MKREGYQTSPLPFTMKIIHFVCLLSSHFLRKTKKGWEHYDVWTQFPVENKNLKQIFWTELLQKHLFYIPAKLQICAAFKGQCATSVTFHDKYKNMQHFHDTLELIPANLTRFNWSVTVTSLMFDHLHWKVSLFFRHETILKSAVVKNQTSLYPKHAKRLYFSSLTVSHFSQCPLNAASALLKVTVFQVLCSVSLQRLRSPLSVLLVRWDELKNLMFDEAGVGLVCVSS